LGSLYTQHVGSIRYVGKVLNNPKAGDALWLGVEWDFEAELGGPGKHYGEVDGIRYFSPQHHLNSDAKCASFVRLNKVKIGGKNIIQVVKDKYLDDIEAATGYIDEKMEVFVKDPGNHLQGKNEVPVQEDGSQALLLDNIQLSYAQISDISDHLSWSNTLKYTKELRLDRNFLYSWDQYFLIVKELKFLNFLALTGNKLRRLTKEYFEGKNVEEMTSPRLQELVLNSMSLDWAQVDALAPTLKNVSKLVLGRNNISKISSEFKIDTDNFESLTVLNL